MNLRRAVACAAVLAALLLIGAGDALSSSAAAPPSLVVEVVGKGKVSGTGINCGSGSTQCYAAYSSSASAFDLTESAASGWSFDHWADYCSGSGAGATCPVTPTANHVATAVFKQNSATTSTGTFNVGVSGTGDVTNGSTEVPIDCGTNPTCSATVLSYSTITVIETPGTGASFGGWGGACSGQRPSCTASVGESTTANVSAAFIDAGATKTLTVTVDGDGTVTGGGISCTSQCSAEEPANSSVVLKATPGDNNTFTGWDGACTGTQPTCTVQMSDVRDVTANFDPWVPVLLTVNGNGKVTGANVTCGPGPATCQGGAAPNTNLVLTATPATTTGGVTWSGCTSVSGNVCQKSVSTSSVAITATFSGSSTPPPSTFTLSVDVEGNGYVTSSNGSIYCTAFGGVGCSASLAQNTSVTLTAVPASGSSVDFTGWDDDCSGTTLSCTFTMTGAKGVTANFNPPSNATYSLTASLGGTGSGTISGAGLKCSSGGGSSCSALQAATANVTITATPSAGSTFTGWSGACSGTTSTCKVSMTGDKNVTATFARSSPTSATLSVSVTGAGTVKGTSGLACTSKAGHTVLCSREYPIGTKVTLSATPAKGQVFTGWKGACTGTKPACTVTLSATASVTATFAKPILAASHKPTVAKVSGGYRVHLYYLAGEPGTLKLSVARSGRHVGSRSKTVSAGTGSLLVPLKVKGRYVFALTLTGKAGSQTIHWVVVI